MYYELGRMQNASRFLKITIRDFRDISWPAAASSGFALRLLGEDVYSALPAVCPTFVRKFEKHEARDSCHLLWSPHPS